MTEELSAAELAVRLEQGSVVVVDLRPAEQVARGYIPGSWPVAIAELPGRLRDVDDALRRWVHRGSSAVAVVADDEDQHTAATTMFREVGLDVVRVAGGVRAWSRAGQPLNHD